MLELHPKNIKVCVAIMNSSGTDSVLCSNLLSPELKIPLIYELVHQDKHIYTFFNDSSLIHSYNYVLLLMNWIFGFQYQGEHGWKPLNYTGLCEKLLAKSQTVVRWTCFHEYHIYLFYEWSYTQYWSSTSIYVIWALLKV